MADSPSAKKVFSCLRSTTATNPHPVNVPALKKNQKKLEKILIFFKKSVDKRGQNIYNIDVPIKTGDGGGPLKTTGRGKELRGLQTPEPNG